MGNSIGGGQWPPRGPLTAEPSGHSTRLAGVEQGEFHRTEPDLPNGFVHSRLARPTREPTLPQEVLLAEELDASVVAHSSALPVPRLIQISKLAGIGAAGA